jgi:hypothetical protein
MRDIFACMEQILQFHLKDLVHMHAQKDFTAAQEFHNQ